MAKISELPVAGALTGAEIMPIVQDGAAKQVPFDTILDEQAMILENAANAKLAEMTLAAAGVTSQITNIGPTKAVVQTIIGSTTPDTLTANMAATMWGNAQPLTEPSITPSVNVRMSGAAVLVLFLVDPVTLKILAKSADIAAIAGNANPTATPFGAFVAPTGTILQIYRKSGAGALRYGSGTFPALSTTAANYIVGDTVPALSVLNTTSFAIEWTTQAVTEAIEPRLAAGEAAQAAIEGDSGDTETRTLGPATFNVTGSAANTFHPALPVWADGIAEGVRIDFPGASVGLIEYWRRVNGVLRLTSRRVISASASGTAIYPVPNWAVKNGGYVTYRRLGGANPTYSAGYGYYYMATGGTPAIGDSGTILASAAAAGSINMALVMRVPKRRSTRNSFRADRGPMDVEYQQFAGTSTPSGWSIASPFSVNEGLLASGAGGWDKVAQWRDLGGVLRGGWSGAHKRRLTTMVQVNDVTGIGGISTAVQLANTGGGTVAMIDGAAGKLRLYYWTGGATAGTLIAETPFTAALVAGRYYLLSAVKDGWTITITLTDVLTGSATTVTGTYSSITTARLHGRVGITHISGDFKWDWVRIAHDVPRNLRAVLIGDSNPEGTLLGGAIPWFNDLAATYGNMLNCSAGGEHTGHMLARINDIVDLRPNLVLIAGGTNDVATQSLAFTRSNIRGMLDACDQIGAEAILLTPPPWVANASAITGVANDMTSGFYGRRRVIDLLGLLSNANDRLTWNATFHSGDNIHFNAAGNTAIKAYVPRVVPELVV